MDLDKIIQEKCTVSHRSSLKIIDGCVLPEQFEDMRNEYDNLEINDNDIWISTFPKCGTTWTQEMVWLIANNLDYEGAKKNLDQRIPFLELDIVFDVDAAAKDLNLGVSKLVNSSLDAVKRNKDIVKTHLPMQCLPRQIREGLSKPKIIYVARNPKDVCVSYYHHSKLIDNFSVTFEEFCELFLAGKVLWGPFWDHLLPFWNQRLSPNILFLKYEDMKKDLEEVIHQVATFLGRSLNSEDVEKLSKHLSFESMSKNLAVNKDEVVELANKLHQRQEKSGKFMRKGVVGDHKEKMSPAMVKRFDEWIRKNIAGSDYTI